MNAFIFQSTRDRYDLEAELRPGKAQWLATRYRHAMRPGDIVYFWMAGPEQVRGLYGWGKIVGKPRRLGAQHVVDVAVEQAFATPILATVIRKDKVLSGLLILKVPQATNFLLSAAEAMRLASLVEEQGESPPKRHPYGARTTTPSRGKRDRIFISYSHVDKEWLIRLQVHLAPLVRSNPHVLWDDTKITPGEKWKAEIGKAMASAKVALLLVSADFLASQFIMENELPRLLASAADEGAVILPIIAGPCRFRETESLAQFQAINAPSRPLSAMTPHEREDTFYQASIASEAALATAKRSHD